MTNLTADRDSGDDISPRFKGRHQRAAGGAAAIELDQLLGGGSLTEPGVAEETTPSREEEGRTAVQDVARGVTEIPRAIAAGARDAVQETLELTETMGLWMEEMIPLGGMVYDPEKGLRFEGAQGFKAAEAVRAKPGIEIPDIEDPTTMTGGMVKGISQFLTGFLGAGKLKVFKALQPVSTAGRVGKAATQGAIADFTVFDPHEARLSNLVEKYPALQNPVTEYLASAPDDTEIEGRVKNLLEGLGLGVATDGFIQGLKVLRRARLAKREVAVATQRAFEAEIAEPDLSIIGDAKTEDLLAAKVKTAVSETKGLSVESVVEATKEAEDPDLFINFARINAPDDIKNIMQNMADISAEDINTARRGVRSWAKTKLSAEQRDSWADLMSRRKGEPLNAEQSVAARQLWATSSTKLAETARLAADSPSDSNLFAFRKMLATHYAIQKEVIAARTETARALNSWKIPTGSSDDMTRQMEAMLDGFGGTTVNRDLAKKIAYLAEMGDARSIEALVDQGTWVRTKDAVAQVWINGLLSSPHTHAVNFMSNWSVVANNILERGVSARLGRALGDSGSVELGEATHMMFGMMEGFKDSLRAAWKTRGKTFLSDSTEQILSSKEKYEILPGRLNADTWNVAKDTPMGQALNMVDTATRAPGIALRLEDEWFKTIGYRMELHAQALRHATQEVRGGTLEPEGLKDRIRSLIDTPPEDVRMASIDAAFYSTFTGTPNKIMKGLGDAVQNIPLLGRVILPFKNTPINLMSYTFERTPLAPLSKQWRADVTAGGAREQLALTRVATGSMLLMASMDLALNEQITGKAPKDAGARANFQRRGQQEYSVKAGDVWYSYDRLDPMGTLLGLGADIAGIIANANEDEESTIEEAVAASTLAIANNVTSKTYMLGVSELFAAMGESETRGKRYFQRLAGSIVPAGVALASRQTDPYMKQASDMQEAIQRRIPFWNESLPKNLDLWGRPRDYRSPHGVMYDALSPIYAKKENPEPIDAELKRLEFYPNMPRREITYKGVTLDLSHTPKIYTRYVALAGNEIKLPQYGNKGAKDFLNALVSNRDSLSPLYELYSDEGGGKADYIQGVVNDYRDAAEAKLIDEFPELQAEFHVQYSPFGNKLNPNLFGRTEGQ